MDWTKPKAYLAKSFLDVDYAQALFAGCVLTGLGVYDWLIFMDETGLEDEGDYYDHDVYPEINS